jgi:uncharacterized protein (DUF302 family)
VAADSPDAPGIRSIASGAGVDETVERLRAIVRERSAHEFVLIDHDGGAREAGLEMRPARVLIFGNPAVGTPVMLASPLAALDLPLRILVWQDGDGQTWLSYPTPEWFAERFGLGPEVVAPLRTAEVLAAAAAAG